MSLEDIPSVPISFVPAKSGQTWQLGGSRMRVLEDGSKLNMRLSSFELTIPPHTNGPAPHWHEMHDESFLVTEGTVRFHIPGKPDVDAQVGDYVVFPTRNPHTFSNPTESEAKFFGICTPGFFVNYFKVLAELMEKGTMTKEKALAAMQHFATLPVPEA